MRACSTPLQYWGNHFFPSNQIRRQSNLSSGSYNNHRANVAEHFSARSKRYLPIIDRSIYHELVETTKAIVDSYHLSADRYCGAVCLKSPRSTVDQ